jgi:predicted metal-binding protein
MSTTPHPGTAILDGLKAQARSLGASAAAIIPAKSLIVEDRLAALCAAPQRCPGYGLAPGCPPHAISPAVFRRRLEAYQHILVFKIDAPIADLLGPERLPLARSIHRIAATLERAACNRGLALARGLAAGSCKELFCGEEEVCVVLHKQQPCRHPDLARPSLSAMGINFTALAQSVGWQFARIDPDQASEGEASLGLMAGLVLLA